ncbi:MAG: hypothetical protein ACRCVT_15430 [Leadbetterella sp.]
MFTSLGSFFELIRNGIATFGKAKIKGLLVKTIENDKRTSILINFTWIEPMIRSSIFD